MPQRRAELVINDAVNLPKTKDRVVVAMPQLPLTILTSNGGLATESCIAIPHVGLVILGAVMFKRVNEMLWTIMDDEENPYITSDQPEIIDCLNAMWDRAIKGVL